MSPAVRTLMRAKYSRLLAPMPGIFPMGSPAMNAATSPGVITVSPSGLSRSEAILARNLAGAAP